MQSLGDTRMNTKRDEDLQGEVGFPKANLGAYVEYEEVGDLDDDIKHELTGEKGYRTMITGHGVKHGDYYFEVEVLPPKIPVPFIGVKPAIRVGFTNFEEQGLELPLGVTKRSYTYASNGRMITNAKYRSEKNNEPYGTNDIIGVYLHLFACKPAFMRKSKTSRNNEKDDELFTPKLDSLLSVEAKEKP